MTLHSVDLAKQSVAGELEGQIDELLVARDAFIETHPMPYSPEDQLEKDRLDVLAIASLTLHYQRMHSQQ